MQSDRSPTDPVRAMLSRLLADRGDALGAVSRAIGKNHAYLHQFLSRGYPAILPAAVRTALGRYFGIEPDLFRPPEDRPGGPRAIDPDLLARANHVARYVIGDRAEDEPDRVDIAAAVYTLLERGAINDDEGTLRVLEGLARRLRGRKRTQT